MRIAAIALALLAMGAFADSTALGASAALMNDGSSVVVATDDGKLELWKRGAPTPEWIDQLRGSAAGAQSPIAALSVLPDDTILVVERRGHILTISSSGKHLSERLPFYGFVRLKPEFGEVDWGRWDRDLDYIATTTAAFTETGNQYLYLVPDEYSPVVKLNITDIVHNAADVMTLSGDIAFQFKDHNFTILKKSDPPSLTVVGEWPSAEAFRPSTVAACAGWVIIGSVEGYVEFIDENEKRDSKNRRLRQVQDQKYETRTILDAGCLGEKLAFTVSFDTGHGQIQIWNMETQTATSWVGLGSGGHPGMAFDAIPSRDGSRLLSLGDGDIRLWEIHEKKIKLIAKYYLKEPHDSQIFSAVSLASDDFIFFDGLRIWLVPTNGGDMSVYAGTTSR